MGQQPNIELEISDLPRPKAAPSPARRWKPQRPGEMNTPAEVPWGGAFGTTGPDTGYAMRLVQQRDIPHVEGEDHHSVQIAIVTLAGARASHYGRAPIGQDVDVAMTLLGYMDEGMPPALMEELRVTRRPHIANIGHDAGRERAMMAAVPVDVLVSSLENIRTRMAAGERLIDW